ncbi:uncharacterized protein Brca2 [Epargyreus clarus]|uniref:uncharacterized protein Brca2 n=1 Tax=Epargyreus clarus TaxID=520877 RepID=UPI003C2B09FF
MDESGNNIETFEAILKLRSEKKPLSLYDTRNKQCSASKILKPQDVISSVSRQLREMQKADCLQRKRNHITKTKQSEFLHVNDMYRRETHHQQIKFETQCVTDTQLIDIVDSVEAMVDVNKGMADEFETTFCHKPDKQVICVENDSTLYQKDTKNNVSRSPDEGNELIEGNDGENINKSNVTNDCDIFDINTDVCKEFETSYCRTNNDNMSVSKENEVEINIKPVIEQFFKDTVTEIKEEKMLKDRSENIPNVNVQDINVNILISEVKSTADEEYMHIEKCVTDILLSPSSKVEEQDKDNICTDCKTESDKIDLLPYSIKEDSLSEKCDDTQMFDEEDTRIKDAEGPSSPIFNHFKPKIKKERKSPLVYTLEAFEKFESLAIPVLEEIADFETAKHLINSQIINKELVIQDITSAFDKEDKVLLVDKSNSDKNNEDSNKDYSNKETNAAEIKTPIKRPSISIKDEILFSSDEENDYLENNKDELPMTCPLKTSPKSEMLDLNKTVFVGFQTCSNKSIQVLKESFDKAKSIFDNIDQKTNEDLTFTELVEIYDANSNNININIVKELSNDKRSCNLNTENDADIIKEENININPLEAEFVGFKTANGKSIDVSEKALQNSKNVFKDIEGDIFDTKSEAPSLNVIGKKREFLGFKTANNKRIKLSEEALAKEEPTNTDLKSIKTDKNMETNLQYDNDKMSVDDDLFHKNDDNEDLNIVDQTLLQEFENESIEESISKYEQKDNNVEFLGFKTASNKNIEISATAMKKSEDIFKEINKGNYENFEPGIAKVTENRMYPNSKPATSFVGFKTGNNKEIKISEKALAKTKDLFQDFDLDDFTNDFDCNKNKLNTERKSKADKRLQSKSSNNKDENIKYLNYSANRINKKSPSEVVPLRDKGQSNFKLSKVKSYSHAEIDLHLNDICTKRYKEAYPCITKYNTEGSLNDKINKNHVDSHEPDKINEDITIFKGLKNTSKTVNISEEAYSKTIKTFKEINTVRANKDIRIEGNDNNDIRILPNKNNNTKESTFSGFKTANNKPIEVSEEALTKSKRILQDIDVPDMNIEDNSKHDLNTKMAHRDNKSCDDEGINVFEGFKTASNKNIEVTKEALINSRQLFKDIDNSGVQAINNETTADRVKDSDNLPPVFEGFKTASNKHIQVSENALLKSKKILDSVDYTTNNLEAINNNTTATSIKGDNFPSALEGFKTASNKNIHVPERAIMNAKNIFKDIDSIEKDENCGNFKNKFTFQGFKTAGNKAVKVSEEALLKSKKILQDIDINCSHDKSKTDGYRDNYDNEDGKDSMKHSTNTEVNANIEVNKKSFEGFKTASNKNVKISESALAKTKDIFKDFGFDQEVNFNDKERLQNVIIPSVVDGMESKIKPDCGIFKGFQTANNKAVKVSEEALARRKIFEDFNVDNQNKNKLKEREFINKTDGKKVEDPDKDINVQEFGFKTGTNKTIKISEDSLKKSRDLFANIDNNLSYTIKSNIDSEIPKNNSENLDSILNTQVLNNFEESLHTEDFYSDVSPKQSKRSGSPILSCPKAKKRKKFETPYRSDRSTFKVQTNNTNPTTDTKYKFNETYKKTKKYTLKDLSNINENKNKEIDPYILNFEFDTLLNFEFARQRNDLTDVSWTTDNIKTCFLESVNRKIIPDGWLDNHLKLIMWKLISYEIRFADTTEGVCSVKNVLEQLKYRYDKELYNVERPALRKILEKDDVSTRTMVLAVVGVYVDGVRVNSATNPSTTIELLLTDGWYCVKACLDRMLVNLVCNGRIAVGSKIATVGAELLNCEQGVSPWEDTSSVRLKLFGNSTRPAHWDAKLGYHSNGSITSQLSTILVSGGKVARTRALVVRVYPALHVERFQDGSTVTRSERLENLHQMKYETERQMQLEKLYEEVEKEFFEQDSPESEGLDLKKSLLSGTQLNENMKSGDSNEFRTHLTDSQSTRLQDTSRRREKLLEALQKRFQERIQKQGLDTGRNVVTLLKIRVADFQGVDNVVVTKAMISIWRPNDAILDIVKEGSWIDVFNVVPTAVRNSEIQISAGRQSVFCRSKYKENAKFKPLIQSLKRKCFTIYELVQNPTMGTDFNEIDTLGIVFLIEPSTKEFDKKAQFQNVYLTDIDKNIICVNFWGGIKKFGYENIFSPGNIVACSNLLKRAGNTRKSIPQYRAMELSTFTESSKFENVRKMADVLLKSFCCVDKKKFIDDCVLSKNNVLLNRYNNVSPYRFNTSDYNLTKNKIFIDSPLTKDNNFNLTGLDFESSFKISDLDLRPEILKRKQKVNEKIAKLKMYGEPPPLNNMYIINKIKNAGSAYKSPLTADISSVASTKNVNDSPVTSNKLESSPILSNNRVIRAANPIKLNFSNLEDEKGSNPFEEEFDASPPLSLD